MLFRSAAIYGWKALTRPITLVLIAATLTWIALSLRRAPLWRLVGPKRANLALLAALMVTFGAGLWFSLPLSWGAGLAPIAVCTAGIVGCLVILGGVITEREATAVPEPMHHVGLTTGFILATPAIGLFAAGFAYVTSVLWRSGIGARAAVATALVLAALQIALLSFLFDLSVEKELVGRAITALLGY